MKPGHVAIGLLGTTLDAGRGPRRWENWRPTVALCRQPDLLVRRLELLYPPRYKALADGIREDVLTVSPETEVRLHSFENPDPWDFEQVYGLLHDFAGSYPFDTESEDYLIHITTGTHVAQICLFLLTESRHLPGRLIQLSPDRDRSAPGSYRVIDLDLSRYDRIASRFRQEQRTGTSYLKGGIDTKNTAFNQIIERIERVAAATRDPLLLMGPTGAGKSLLAKRIFELKKHRHAVEGDFVDVNCATVRGDQAMSALFGHTKGAFTGALKDRQGLLRSAHRGVLFLDEIGELGLDEQAMLLRAIEDKTFLPMGSDRTVSSDFQLLAGTNQNLWEAVRAGRFREDLLARINLWTFTLPGLRDRREDIEPNLDYELEQFAVRTGHRVTFNKEARHAFLEFARSPHATWTGNFRDLGAAVSRMATFAEGGRIHLEIVREEIRRLEQSWVGPAEAGQGNRDRTLDAFFSPVEIDALDLFDRVQLEEAIRVCSKSRTLSEAGRILFEASRKRKNSLNDADRLRKYLARFGLTWDRLHPAAALPDVAR
ncbi:MAG: sigma 54-interacting transcriptional regulator [Bryobacterales bacterium]|nr:sigma 54-interacting transcriptional regulator [Bryobacterales bacterium]